MKKEFVKKITVAGKNQPVKICFDYSIDETRIPFIEGVKVYAENLELKKYSKAEVLNTIFNYLDEQK